MGVGGGEGQCKAANNSEGSQYFVEQYQFDPVAGSAAEQVAGPGFRDHFWAEQGVGGGI